MSREEIINLINEAVKSGASKKASCSMFDISIRTLQRWIQCPKKEDGRSINRCSIHNALSKDEEQKIIDVSCSPEYRDMSPNQIVPDLAGKGIYIASESTFYRVLKRKNLMTHRSRAKAPERNRPEEISANAPNQVWTWDITYLLTNVRGVYLYLYLILDIWDRSIVGWTIQERESGKYAAYLINETCMKQGVRPGELVVHQDNGSPMVSSEYLAALSNWGLPSYSRPGVSDDNSYSESQFKTLKYRPEFPGRFASSKEATGYIKKYVEWYNTKHLHSGIGFVTPDQRRYGMDFAILECRKATYNKARDLHPERWSRGIRKWGRPEIVTLNPRDRKNDGQNKVA